MNKKAIVFVTLCCLLMVSCSSPPKPYKSEVRSRAIDAGAGRDYAEYAVYNPTMSADIGIEALDAEYATGTFRLLNPTLDKLKSLSEIDYVTLYYNQQGHVIIELKGH